MAEAGRKSEIGRGVAAWCEDIPTLQDDEGRAGAGAIDGLGGWNQAVLDWRIRPRLRDGERGSAQSEPKFQLPIRGSIDSAAQGFGWWAGRGNSADRFQHDT